MSGLGTDEVVEKSPWKVPERWSVVAVATVNIMSTIDIARTASSC